MHKCSYSNIVAKAKALNHAPFLSRGNTTHAHSLRKLPKMLPIDAKMLGRPADLAVPAAELARPLLLALLLLALLLLAAAARSAALLGA